MITFVAFADAANTTDANGPITIPASVQPNDFAIWVSGKDAGDPFVGTQPGWDSVVPDFIASNSNWRIVSRRVQAGDTTVAWTGASGTHVSGVAWFRGVASIGNKGTHWKRSATTNICTCPAVTRSVAGSSIVAIAGERSIAATAGEVGYSSLVGATFIGGAAGDTALSASTRIALPWFAWKGSAEAEGDVTWTFNDSSGNGMGIQIELVPDPEPPSPWANMAVWVGGTEKPVESVEVWDGAALKAATAVGVMPFGSPSVDAMLAEETFYWAHRGGSLTWPEMSLWAYTQSVARGVHALEVSLARTSDGVWFGLHDDTINRTSPGAPANSVASSMTWAQVQQYAIDYRSPAQPYMRLEEICALYGSSHVIVLDPKYQLSRGAEMLDKALEQMPAARLIGKYSGMTANTTFTTACAARGIKTWGYFYEADIASVAAQQGKWDILGQEYGASQATWDTMLSFGKPVVAHIVPSRVTADTAIAKGAHGCQVSGVADVMGAGV